MAKVTYQDPIHHLSGKISKNYRTTYCYRKRNELKFTQVRSERSTPLTEAEQNHRQIFATVCKATRARMCDPVQMANDMLAFSRQTKYKTLYSYVWNQEYAKVK
ncbi:MAG: hypothetical protein ACI4TV_04870 [Paludibacteraceae bacterium]